MILKRGWPAQRQHRILAGGQAANTGGDALSASIMPLHLVFTCGATPGDLAIALAAVALASTAGALVAGRYADHIGRMPLAVFAFTVSAFALVVAGLSHDVLVASSAWAVAAGAARCGKASRNAYIAIAGGADRVRLRAYLRNVLNVSYSAATGVAAALVLLAASQVAAAVPGGQATLLSAGVMLDAILTLGAVWCYWQLSRETAMRSAPVEQSRNPPSPRVRVERDFVRMSLALAVIVNTYELAAAIVAVVLVAAQGAPGVLIPLTLGVFTVLSLAVQMHLAARVSDTQSAVAGARRATVAAFIGLALVVGASLIGGSSLVVIALAGIALVAPADALISAARWELEMGLARQEAQGAYQGVSEAANSAVGMVLPAGAWLIAAAGVVTAPIVLGAYAAAGFLVGPLARRVRNGRTQAGR